MISRAILQTLKYSDHFGFPLTLDELHARLISFPITQIRLIRQTRLMLQKHLLQKTKDYYHLPGRSSLVARRLKRAKLSKPLITRAQHLSSLLSPISSILAIYLTGSLAVCNSNANADIDLMIITQNHRLWTTRLILTLYTSFLGLRRTPNSTKNTGKLCLNLYLTPASYQLPTTKRSLYTAYELLQAIPLYDPEGTHSALLAANPWIKNYLPNFPIPHPTGPGPIGTIVEKLAYWIQIIYMRPRLTRELITPDSAFFHPRDPSPKV